MFCVPIFQATQRFDLPVAPSSPAPYHCPFDLVRCFRQIWSSLKLLGFSVFFFVFSVFSSSGSTFALHWGIQSVSTLSKPLAPCINLVFPIFLIVGKICSNRKKNYFLKNSSKHKNINLNFNSICPRDFEKIFNFKI